MIQIDDAGSGSFVGGTCIGIYRPETQEYYFDFIPVELYSIDNFNSKQYLSCVIDIVSHSFEKLGVEKNEEIVFCRGYMFEKLEKWLDDKLYIWRKDHIDGELQNIIEKNFEIYATKLGVFKEYIKYTKFPFHFHKILRWVLADYPSRIQLCKTGWKSWQKYKQLEMSTRYDYLNKNNCYCLNCGKYLYPGQMVKILEYSTNRNYYIYLHSECNPSK